MRKITSARLVEALESIAIGKRCWILNVLVHRVDKRNWRFASGGQKMLLSAMDELMNRAGFVVQPSAE